MSGSIPQAGFFYQNSVAAFKILELLEFGSPIKRIYLENYNKGKHIDDVIIEYLNFTRYYQIKWSEDEAKSYTIHNLITPQSGKTKSLFKELAEGYTSVQDKKNVEIILYSTKKASNQKQPKQDINHNLDDFINEIHKPFSKSSFTKISDVAKYNEYETIINKLIQESGLDLEHFNSFVKCLRFELEQPNIDEIKQKIYIKLKLLGIEENLYDTLLNSVVQWSITGQVINANDVLEKLGIADRFVDGIVHDFPVEEEFYVKNTSLFEQLDRSIAELNSGFILLEGHPGTGKSTALTMYQRQRENVRFAYYCFIPDEKALGHPRLERDTFLKSLCIGIQNSFPEVDFPQIYSQEYQTKLQNYLDKLRQLGTKVVFIIDGLDHVDNKKEKLEYPLTYYLEGSLPDNIIFILSSQYPEAISDEIQAQIKLNPLRHIKTGRFSKPEVEDFLQRRKIYLSIDELSIVAEKSEGIPLYLYYIAQLLLEENAHQYANILNELPSLKNEKIDFYHNFLYNHISQINLAVWTLAILAHRKEYTTTAIVVELLTLLNFICDSNQIEEILKRFKHLLKLSDSNSYTIFHNSFREFILEKTNHLTNDVNTTLIRYYKNNPHSDETYRNFYRHLFEIRNYQEILSNCNEEWLEQSWKLFRPFKEINFNLDLAWEAAVQIGSLKEFIRIAFLKQEFGTVERNFERAEFNLSHFLLEIGKIKDAVRSVWDGERVNYTLVEFSQFVVEHNKRAEHLLSERIANSGLHTHPKGISPDDLSKYYQAVAFYKNWSVLFDEINNYRWHRKDEHSYTIEWETEEENVKINNSIKDRVIESLYIAKKYESLLSIAQNYGITQQIRNQALLYTIIIFIAENEISEATKLLEEIDFTQFKHKHYNQLFILFAEKGFLGKIQAKININYLPSTLFSNLNSEDIHRGIKKELLTLYDELRVYFTQNPDGYRLFVIRASAFDMPEKGFFLALIELAQLWCDTLSKQLSEVELTKRTKRIFDYLNIDRSLKQAAFHTYINDPYYIGRDIHKIYCNIFLYITKFLTSSQISELVKYWLLLDVRPDGYKNLKINIEFAKIIKAGHNKDVGNVIKSLLERAEVQARQDEETYSLVNELLMCAEAYGYCGFEEDAIRLWEELFTLGCGIYYRKDYQFNEAIYALRLAHKYHPEKSLERLSKLLTLVHKLEGAAQGRTIARAVEKLIVFACELSPEIALELLHREDDFIVRESAIQDLVTAFTDLGNTNLWYVWAIVKTMEKWGKYDKYNEYTYPTKLKFFEKVLQAKDINLIQEIYYLNRHQLLVEQDRPGGVFEFADCCIRCGFELNTAKNDIENFREAREKEKAAEQERNGISRTNTNNENTEFQEIKNLAINNFDEFSERLEQLRQSYLQVSRLSEVKNAYQELKNIFITFYETLSQEAKSVINTRRLSIIKQYAKFKKQILKLQIFQQQEYRVQVRCIAENLIDGIGKLTCLDNWEKTLYQLFNINKWIEDFILKTNQPDYSFNRKISNYFIQIVNSVSLANLAKLEQLCRQFLLGDELSKCLVALAKRQSKLKPDYSQKLLIEAWEEKKNFLYLDSDLAKELLNCLFTVNLQAAKTFLMATFSHEYKIYSKDLIYHLDQVTEFANYFDEEDIYEYLYHAYEKHNIRLAEGLTKNINYKWLSNYSYSLSFQESVIRYLVRLLEYPEIEIRKLSLSSLYSLIYYEPLALSKIIDFCHSENDNIKEHILSLIFSIAISNLELALQHKQMLLQFLDVPHFNIKQTAKEILLFCVDRGENLKSEEIRKIEATNRPPQVFLPCLVDTGLSEGKNFIPSEYQLNILKSLYAPNENGEVIRKVYTRIIRSGWTIQQGMELESATHREHNINSNFDAIEINGQYFQAVQSALNEVFNQEIINQSYEEAEIQIIKRRFRLYDPTDIYIKYNRKPEMISWISPEISDEDFLDFGDVEQTCFEFLNREEDWITLYEEGSQRVDDSLKINKRTTYFTVIAFLARKDDYVAIQTLEEEKRIKPYILKENYYRFEIPNVFRSGTTFPISGIRPIIGISENNFRGQHNLSIASLLPDTIEELGLFRNRSECLNYSHGNETVVDFSYWQEVFDQDRRRQKPKSAGVALKIQRHFLQSFLDKNGYQLCFILELKRSTDKYCSEEDMKWQFLETIFYT